MKILSLGAGVQSSVIALACDEWFGETPDYAIFADTGYEPKAVYKHLEWLEKQVSFPVISVKKGNIKNDLLQAVKKGTRYITMPFHTLDSGIANRQCTKEYKIDPINKKIRELLGLKPRERTKQKAEVWMGISLDEIQRMKDSNVSYTVNRFPLIEKKLHRYDCLNWFAKHFPSRTLPRSACICCPFHSNQEWDYIKKQMPEEFADVCEFDKQIRHLPNFKQQLFLHTSCIPLSEVNFRNENQYSLLDECYGMCGV